MNAIFFVVARIEVEWKKVWLTKNISRQFSTSAASFLCIRIIFFSILQSDAVFSYSGMNANA
jgi:hypothetical protein